MGESSGVQLDRFQVGGTEYRLNRSDNSVVRFDPGDRQPWQVPTHVGYLFQRGARWDWYVGEMDGDWPARFLDEQAAIEDLVAMHG